jgi:hypothetical protein
MGIVEMKNRIGDWLNGSEWPRVHRDVRRFLKTWSFYVSEPGMVYARAEARTLTPGGLELFLARLVVISDETFPRIVAIDLSTTAISPRHWTAMQEALAHYARHIQAHLISGLRGGSHRNYAMIWR